jgi:hypothetical protein
MIHVFQVAVAARKYGMVCKGIREDDTQHTPPRSGGREKQTLTVGKKHDVLRDPLVILVKVTDQFATVLAEKDMGRNAISSKQTPASQRRRLHVKEGRLRPFILVAARLAATVTLDAVPAVPPA